MQISWSSKRRDSKSKGVVTKETRKAISRSLRKGESTMDVIKNTKKYKAKIVLAGFPKVTVEVSGEPIVIESKSFLKLFIYQLPFISISGKTCVLGNSWRVAEETTGMLIGSGQTKQGAISSARAVLKRYSKEKIIEQIQKYK